MTANVCRRWSLTALVLLSSIAIAQNTPADSILLHGRIYTVDSKHPWAQAIAIRDGKFLAVGSDKEISRFRGTATKVFDAKERLVLPGISDCHVHFLDGSFSL